MQKTDDMSETLVRQLIQQIKSHQTKEALSKIESLDEKTLDQTIVIEDEYYSVLKAAIESDALEIINKLIEKKCNLEKNQGIKKALKVWWIKHECEKFQDLSPIAINIFSVLFTAMQQMKHSIRDILDGVFIPVEIKLLLLQKVIGEKQLLRYMLSPLENNVVPMSDLRLNQFNECLKLFSHIDSICEEDIFTLRLISHQLKLRYLKFDSPENAALFSEIDKTFLDLSKNSSLKETKSQLENKSVKDLLIPQVSPPMQDFPENEYWRLFVDGSKQVLPEEHGWVGYEEREAGCLQTMYDAFLYAREDLPTTELTYEIADEIHRRAAAHLSSGSKIKFRDSCTRSGIKAFEALSYAGFLETTKPPYNTWYQIEQRKAGSHLHLLHANFELGQYVEEEKIVKQVKKIIHEYHKSFAQSGQNRVKQLQSIIQLASDYARFHPYWDGNNRTAVCILNRELEKHGFPLTIMSNPNELEGHSQAELFLKVCEGMQNFLRVKNGQPYGTSKTTNQLIIENGKPPPIQVKSLVKPRLSF